MSLRWVQLSCNIPHVAGLTVWPRGLKRRFYGDRVIQVQLTSSSRCVVASLDKALYNNYLCLVVSNKQQFNWEEVK